MHPFDTNIFDIVLATPNNASAGAALTFPAPTNTRIEILGVDFVYTADATAANRRIQITSNNGVDTFGKVTIVKNVAATQAIKFHCHTGIEQIDDVTANADLYIKLPNQLYLREGDNFIIQAINIQATDVISEIAIRFKQWIME